MSFENCQFAAINYAKEQDIPLDAEQISEFAEHLNALRKESLTSAEMDKAYDDFIALKEAEIMNENVEDMDSLHKATQIVKTLTIDNKGVFDSAESAVKAAIEGNPTRASVNLNRDVRAMGKDIEATLLAQRELALGPDRTIIESGLMDEPIGVALVQMQDQLPLTVTDPIALRIAKALNSVIERAFELKRGLNPQIERAMGYIIKETHDRAKLMELPSELPEHLQKLTPKQAWISWVAKNFDINGAEGMGMPKRAEILSDVYDGMVSGTYGKEALAKGGDVTNKYAKSRVLIPKTPEAFVQYQKMYGAGTLFDGVNKFVSQIAFDVAKTNKFGVNAQKTMEQVRRLMVKTIPPEQVQAFNTSFERGSIRQSFNEVMGYNRGAPSWSTPGVKGWDSVKQKMAYSLAALQTFKWITHGGASGVRSFADVGLTPGLMRTMGETSATMAEITTEYFKHATSAELRAESAHIGNVLMESSVRDLLSKMGADTVPGALAWGAEKVSKLSGLQLHVDSLKSLTGRTLAVGLARDAKVGYKGLAPLRKAALARYGIGELELGLYSQAIESINDVDFLNGQTVYTKLPDSAIGEYIAKKYPGMPASEKVLFRTRLELSNNIGAMINQAADMATSTPTTPDLVLMHQGLDKSTLSGQLLSMALQFKAPILAVTRSLARIYQDGKIVGSQANLGLTGASVLLHTMAADMFLSAVKGEEPRDWKDPKYLGGLAARSLAPIYADIAAKEFFDREGYDPFRLGDLVGPAAGTLMDVTKLAGGTIKKGVGNVLGGDETFENEAYTAARLLSGSVPFRNLPYTIFLFNQFVDYPLKEVANSRKVDKMKKEFHKQPGLFNDERQYLVEPN